MNPKNRIKELRSVKVKDLKEHPDNWRLHPQRQKDAIRKALDKYGMADAFLAYEETDDKGKKSLVLIDGHLRKEEIDPEIKVPVLVLDVTTEEARGLLATHDSIGSMAEFDEIKLSGLLDEIKLSDVEMAGLVENIKDGLKIWDESLLPDTMLTNVDIKGDIGKTERLVVAISFESSEQLQDFLTYLGCEGKELKIKKTSCRFLWNKIRKLRGEKLEQETIDDMNENESE